MEKLEIGDSVIYHGLTFYVVDIAGSVIGVCTIKNPASAARVIWVSPTKVTKVKKT